MRGRLRERVPDPLTALVVLIVATFALLSIGTPLAGGGTFAGVDALGHLSPQRDESMTGVGVHTINVGDSVDFALPNATFFGQRLREGEYPQWNPYILGGVPLAATPNFGLLSPVALPFWFLPGWLAPGYMKLLEIIVAAGGCYLFLRRLRLGRAAGWLGGLAFASSGFLVAWTNWPQSRVTAFIPVLFWALERLVQHCPEPPAVRRWCRPGDVALVALPVAAMILGGFPSVTGYAMLTGAAYLLVRGYAEHRGRRAPRVLAAGAAGMACGVALVAFQLLPWVHFMSHTVIRGREQSPEQHIPPEMLLTTIAPYLFGTVNPHRQPTWFHGRIFMEYADYVGAAVVVLVLVAVAAAGRGRALLPRGVWRFLVGGAGVWTVLVFVGGWPLALAQQLPVLFPQNYVGRARSVLGFLLAALAAAGFQLALDRWRQRATRPTAPEPPDPTAPAAPGAAVPAAPGAAVPARPGAAAGAVGVGAAAGAVAVRAGRPLPARLATHIRRWYGAAVWLVAGLAGLLLARLALRIAYQQNARRNPDGSGTDLVTHLTTELLTGLGLVALAAGCAGWLWWGPAGPSRARRYAGWAAAALLPALVGVQALAFAVPYHPRVDRDYYYPVTDAARYLQRHQGHQRYFGASGAVYGGIEVPHRIRALHGHIYLDRRFAELVETLPGTQFDTPPTYLNADPAGGRVARHPVLDRLAVSHYMAPPSIPPFGTRHAADGDDTVTLAPGRRTTVSFTTAGPLRGVAVTPRASLSPARPTTRISVVVRDGSGATVAAADRIVRELRAGQRFWIPLAAEATSKGTELTATIEVTGPRSTRVPGPGRHAPREPAPEIPVVATGGMPALSTVTAPGDDGLRLVYDDSSVIYERTGALPRARWASRAVVEPDPERRLALLASGRLADHEVVLDSHADAGRRAAERGAGEPAGEDGAAAGRTGEASGRGRGEPARVRWLGDGTDEMSLSVTAGEAGHLVLADAIATSWHASVDGKPVDVVPADHGLAAVPVPAGRHTVRLWYAAPYHNAGGWISMLTGLLLLGLAAAGWWTRRGAAPRRPVRGSGAPAPPVG